MRVRVPWRSFRLRIALLSTVLSTLVLLAFGAYMLLVIGRLSQDRIDNLIRDHAHTLLVPPGAPEVPWRRAEQNLLYLGGNEDTPTAFFLVTGRDGEDIYRSSTWPQELDMELPLPAAPLLGENRRAGGPADPPPPPRLEEHAFFSWNGAGDAWRIGVLSSPRASLALGFSVRAFGTERWQTRRALLLALPVMLILVGASGFLLAQHALRPLQEITARAEHITAQALDQRIPKTRGADEFQRLADVFNDMLDRLERSFAQATRFSADAAHELKTPIAVLQGELERGVQETAPGSPEQVRYGRLLEQVQRLKGIMRKLLLLATADAGQLAILKKPFDLSETVNAMVEDLDVLAPGLAVETRIEAGVTVMADADLLRQVVQNLINNAIKYNDHDGRIGIFLRTRPKLVKLTVFNTGPGIALEDRERIFERFFRVDKARGRDGGNAGLGLSLAREIARAHGGDLYLADARPGGTAFTLRLPVAKGPG